MERVSERMVESGPEGPTSEVMRDSLRARARFFWCRRREREAEVGGGGRGGGGGGEPGGGFEMLLGR